jgi:NTE family protein
VPEVLEKPRDVVERLALIGPFAELSPELRAELATQVEWWRFRAGELLFEQDSSADCAYLIVRGRVRVAQHDDAGDDPGGRERVLGERGAGEPVGEVALLAPVRRTATVRAMRDTDVIRLDRATFDRLLSARPETMVPLVRVLSERLAEALRGHVRDTHRISSLALLVDRRDHAAARVSQQLVAALAKRVSVVDFDAAAPDPDSTSLVETIDAQDARHGMTCFSLDASADPRKLDALRQADCVVVIETGTERSAVIEQALRALDATRTEPQRVVVLLHSAESGRPHGTAARIAGFDRHHHVRAGSSADIDRVARHLTDQAIGVVLSGGGARAMAHVGAYRALTELGVPVDHIGGSSIGGVLAAQIALGWSADELEERNRIAWPRLNLGRRFTVPLLSLLSPKAAGRMLGGMFGSAHLEDLWLPVFVTAVDLTRCRLRICRTGPATRWTLATQAAPGLWPPVVDDDGGLFIDGGVIDNLPVVPMREEGTRRIIAIDVSRRRPFSAGAALDTSPSPARAVRNRLRRKADRGKHAFPGMLQVLNRTAVVTSLERHARSRALTDVYAEPDVDTIGIAEYSTFDQAVTAGYDAARRALEEHAALLASWT